ncbi:MAG TPA: DEAD/DEAH box helicase, partial [Thermoleophilia bacterium]|nr:DEAD/DEAH box helicase [Thermoleophilia bacterium]
MSSVSFTDLGVSAPLVAALAGRDAHEPFAVQSLVIADALAGADILAKSPTGSGKTLAFAIPVLERLDPAGPNPAALVLVPTRELAVQVTEEFALIAPAL